MAKLGLPKTCLICRNTTIVEMEPEAYKRWMKGEYIQDVALSYLMTKGNCLSLVSVENVLMKCSQKMRRTNELYSPWCCTWVSENRY